MGYQSLSNEIVQWVLVALRKKSFEKIRSDELNQIIDVKKGLRLPTLTLKLAVESLTFALLSQMNA